MIKGAIVKIQTGDRVRIVGPSSAPDLWWAELPDDGGNFSGQGERRGDLTLIDRADVMREPTWLTRDRALEIWQNRSSGGDFIGVISREEDDEVGRVWRTMPGSTSWADALLSISQGLHPIKPEKP